MQGNNLRPGVYSRYEVSSFYTAASSARQAALVAEAAALEAGTVTEINTPAAAAQQLAGEPALLAAVEILLRSGVAGVQVAPVKDGDYATPLALVAALDNIGAVLTGSGDVEIAKLLMESVIQASGALRERVGFVGSADGEEALALAKALNCERMVVVTPGAAALGGNGQCTGLVAAAAVAGAVLAQNDAAHNYNGQPLALLALPPRLDEDRVQALLAGGVTVVEPVGAVPRIVRLLTTRTTTGGVTDRTLSGLNTVLIIDEIIKGVRDVLRLRLGGGRISTRSLDTVSAQVTVELARQQDNGLLESFEAPKVYADSEDPAVCIVELAFKVAHVVGQIHVVAHVQV